MGRHKKEEVMDPSIFRLMIEEYPYKQTTINFTNKEEALQYAHDLTSDNTAWYGLYEVRPDYYYLISIEHKRLRPHDNLLPVMQKEGTSKQKKTTSNNNKSKRTNAISEKPNKNTIKIK